ncbi:hypothetical protein DP939_39010 [Spongiactinospora rosea]|uniref:Uncharacterized protein n=1 Tax=Spongiactinospora rosea TaxID=2248750 RepID=A0A366LLG5_9ACTN|nr:hypothetical protein [Spongiactinospora rosea]RBQ14766.1 hypothetical protein DP939_39010 [Spongiactinospora rosea]
MDAARKYEDEHALLDRLHPHQVHEVRAVMLRLVAANEGAAEPEATPPVKRRHLSFAGLFSSGEGDLAERHEEILRDRLNHPV